MQRHKRLCDFDFEPDQMEWLINPSMQQDLVPSYYKGRCLFSITPTLDHDGAYKGHAHVRCYAVQSPKPRIIPNGVA